MVNAHALRCSGRATHWAAQVRTGRRSWTRLNATRKYRMIVSLFDMIVFSGFDTALSRPRLFKSGWCVRKCVAFNNPVASP